MVTSSATCDAAATAYDATKIDCAIIDSAGTYDRTEINVYTTSEFESTPLFLLWHYEGVYRCSTDFNVQVCGDPVMSLAGSLQGDELQPYSSTGSLMTTSLLPSVSFSGGCSNITPAPTCVVTQDTTCSATPVAFDSSLISCDYSTSVISF